MNHPHQFTLNLLRSLIEGAPQAFPRARKNEMIAVYERFLNDLSVPVEEIENIAVEFGKEIWPYREAYQELYDEHGRAHEEALLREGLHEELRPKYEKFLAEKGNIERVRGQLAGLDLYFTSDEQAEIVKAELVAHDKIHGELERLIAGEKQEEYFAALEKWKKKQEQILEALAKLRGFATRSPKWAGEILGKVRTFEQGFGFLERPVSLMDVMGEIEYYEGILGIGEE